MHSANKNERKNKSMRQKSAIVTGGCGFIGTHCVKRLLEEGYFVLCIDNLSRLGARVNREWLRGRSRRAGRLSFVHLDIREFRRLDGLLRDHVQQHGAPEVIIHAAAQVAVTWSLVSPRQDFETNAQGTFNVLEGVRMHCPESTVIYSSTNKVYGCLDDIGVREREKRYEFEDLTSGVPSHRALDPFSPYGCSKAAADQYTRDYARIYGLRTFVFRQSCIYGTRQFGQEDQGWVSWFVIACALQRNTIVYGDGKQLRDLLWVDDLLDAYWAAWRSSRSAGVFNVGGGPGNTLSILELLDLLQEIMPRERALCRPQFQPARPGDQRVYLSDICELGRLGWKPTVSPHDGVEKLAAWVASRREEIEKVTVSGGEAKRSAAA